MKVRSINTATIAGAALGLMFMGFGASPAHAGGVDGTGTTGTCVTNSGQIKLKPALTTAGSGAGALKLKSKIPSCAGGTVDGSHITTGKGKGVGTTMSTACANLLGTQPADITLTVKWKTDGTVKLNASTIHITSQTGGTTMDGHGSFDATGTVTMGSFNGGTVTAHVETDQLVADILTECGGKGVKKLTFGLNGNSSLSIN